MKYHDTDTSLLEGVLSRGDRRLAPAIELAWRRGSRLEGWREHFKPSLWWESLGECGYDPAALHRPFPVEGRLPWDHINVKKGRAYLEKEQHRAVVQLADMAHAH